VPKADPSKTDGKKSPPCGSHTAGCKKCDSPKETLEARNHCRREGQRA